MEDKAPASIDHAAKTGQVRPESLVVLQIYAPVPHVLWVQPRQAGLPPESAQVSRCRWGQSDQPKNGLAIGISTLSRGPSCTPGGARPGRADPGTGPKPPPGRHLRAWRANQAKHDAPTGSWAKPTTRSEPLGGSTKWHRKAVEPPFHTGHILYRNARIITRTGKSARS